MISLLFDSAVCARAQMPLTSPSRKSEFNELFLERIAEGLDLTSELTDSSNNSQMIKK